MAKLLPCETHIFISIPHLFIYASHFIFELISSRAQ